jgi:serine protease Do
MKAVKMAGLAMALAIAAGIGAAVLPPAQAQSRQVQLERPVKARQSSPRVVQFFGGGSRIGVSIRDIEAADKGASNGVVVEEVTENSPAAKAGIRKDDVFVEFDGERVRSVRQLTRLVQETPSGRTVQATVLRAGQRTNLSITPDDGQPFNFEQFERFGDLGREFAWRMVPPAPAAPPAAPGRPAPPAPPAPPSAWRFGDLLGRSARLGMTVDSLSSQLADYFGTKRGVLVTSVTDGSAASKAGIKAGDVITSVNGRAVDDPSDVRRETQNLNDGDEFTVEVVRDKKSTTLKGKVERVAPRRTGRTIL